MFWRVLVDSWYRNTPKVPTKRVRRVFVIEAADSESAMAKAKEHAEATAKFGVDWIGFEAVSGASVTLPMEIKA